MFFYKIFVVVNKKLRSTKRELMVETDKDQFSDKAASDLNIDTDIKPLDH